jgi:hypothetical protein
LETSAYLSLSCSRSIEVLLRKLVAQAAAETRNQQVRSRDRRKSSSVTGCNEAIIVLPYKQS